MYMPIGQSFWYSNKEKRSHTIATRRSFSMISALSVAYSVRVMKNIKPGQKCFSWFLGNNNLNKALYDEKTFGCSDGLQPDRVSLNQGAESLVPI